MNGDELWDGDSVEVWQVATAMPASSAQFLLMFIVSECHPRLGRGRYDQERGFPRSTRATPAIGSSKNVFARFALKRAGRPRSQ